MHSSAAPTPDPRGGPRTTPPATEILGSLATHTLEDRSVREAHTALSDIVARSPRVCVIVVNRLYDPSMDVGRITQVARRVRTHFPDMVVLGGVDAYSRADRSIPEILRRLRENAQISEIAVPDAVLVRSHRLGHSLQTESRRGGLMNAILAFKDGRPVHTWLAGDRTPDVHHVVTGLQSVR